MEAARSLPLLRPGDGIEAAVSRVRLRRFVGALQGTDLNSAARRWLVVDEFTLSYPTSNDERWVDHLVEELLMSRSYAESLDLVRRVASERSLMVETIVRPSEEVQAMGGVSLFQLETTHVSISATETSFQILDVGSFPCVRGFAGLPKDAKVFLRWAQENRLSQMSFVDLIRSLTLVGIRGSDIVPWHEFC